MINETNRVETINARTAIDRSTYLVNEFVSDVKRFSKNHQKTLKDSFDYFLALRIKHSLTNNAKCAWEIRAEKAKLILGL